MKATTRKPLVKTYDDTLPLREQSDEQLLRQYQINAEGAVFAELVRRYQRPLHVHLCKMLRDPAAADDVLQNTLLQLHRRANSFDPKRRLRPWLYSVATNQAIDYMRRNRRHQAVSLDASPDTFDGGHGTLADVIALADDRCSPHSALEAKERSQWVRREVGKLSKPFREVFVRTQLQGLTVRETAHELGLPLGTVKSRNHSARARLLHAWQTRHIASQSEN